MRDRETNEPVGDLPRFEYLLEWYSKHAPTGTDVDSNGKGLEGRIIHGDFKCDNMVSSWCGVASRASSSLSLIVPSLVRQIFHPTEPRVIGVLDWELSTLVSAGRHRRHQGPS